jgi:hypothetical protein
MFRALTCPSSGGKIAFIQHLVSSLSVNGCTGHRLEAVEITSNGHSEFLMKNSAINPYEVRPSLLVGITTINQADIHDQIKKLRNG